MGKEILDIHCPQCGAPANFDIVHQVYECGYCGGTVKVEAALEEKTERWMYLTELKEKIDAQ